MGTANCEELLEDQIKENLFTKMVNGLQSVSSNEKVASKNCKVSLPLLQWFWPL